MTFGSPREDRQSASNFVPLERRVLAERSRRLSWLGCGGSMVYVDYRPATWRQRIKNDMARMPAKFNPFRHAAIARGFMTAPLTPMRL
jgi:hypothetical protein